jgi:hypothetical protein
MAEKGSVGGIERCVDRPTLLSPSLTLRCPLLGDMTSGQTTSKGRYTAWLAAATEESQYRGHNTRRGHSTVHINFYFLVLRQSPSVQRRCLLSTIRLTAHCPAHPFTLHLAHSSSSPTSSPALHCLAHCRIPFTGSPNIFLSLHHLAHDHDNREGAGETFCTTATSRIPSHWATRPSTTKAAPHRPRQAWQQLSYSCSPPRQPGCFVSPLTSISPTAKRRARGLTHIPPSQPSLNVFPTASASLLQPRRPRHPSACPTTPLTFSAPL